MEKIIEVNNLSKKYNGLKAVDNISFSVNKGEIFGILGPNGAGKTTTLEIIEGLRKADEGKITINGNDVRKHPYKVKKIIGVQLQSSSFFDRLSLEELLVLFGSLYNRDINAEEILEEVELTEKKKSYVNKLSGGQKQRFSIASALVNDPVALFLDEPTTGLDPQARRHLWNLIKNIRAKGKTIIITTHYMEEAEFLCDRVAIMDRGKITRLEHPDVLIDNLIKKGFKKKKIEKQANLEDVFLDLTGHSLRE